MKTLIVLSALLAIIAAETYPTTYDNIDVEAIVTNPESLRGFTQCFLDLGTCSEAAGAFKNVLADASQTACAKCTPAQKNILKRYIQEVQKQPDQLKALLQKYDPENKYTEALRVALDL